MYGSDFEDTSLNEHLDVATKNLGCFLYKQLYARTGWTDGLDKENDTAFFFMVVDPGIFKMEPGNLRTGSEAA